jgi:signal transduction histidine kinase
MASRSDQESRRGFRKGLPEDPVPDPSAVAPAVKDAPINILIVDDESKNLTVLETILNDPGYRLIRAESADQALLALVAHEFALMILDIHMPDMTGFELAQLIKQRRKTAGVPIIFLTAYYNEDHYILEGYGTGAVDYLQKPVNPTILRSKVTVFAELHRRTREGHAANRALTAEVAERRRVQEQLVALNDDLERRVDERTAALRDSESRLRLAQAAGGVGVWDWDTQAGDLWWSDSMWTVYGIPPVPSPQIHAAWKSALHPEDRDRVVGHRQQILDAGVAVEYRDEFRILRPDGETRWIEAVARLDPGAPGRPPRMSGMAVDITERKAATEALREADRRKDEFLAMLAHELRNPLAPIRNAVAILRQPTRETGDTTWCVNVIERQCRHLTRLVDDLLDVSRVSRGKIKIQRTLLDLGKVVQQAVETSRPLIDARRHNLTINLPEEPLYVLGDLTRLAQVVANLLNNAAKYTDEGGEILLALEPDSNDLRKATIRVRDNGRGLDASALGNLFQLFFQVDGNLDRSDGGLGIGLSLVRTLVEMHDGSVEAKSPGRGKGSEFLVHLPCVPAPARIGSPSPIAAGAGSMRSLRILVVDDNRDSAESIAKLLELWGHEVRLAHDGLAAVEMALAHRPEVILLDIGLPGLNGYRACQAIRQHGLTDELIIAMTGYGQEEDRRQSLESGFDRHLVKPIDLRTIERLLAERTRQDENR